MTSGQASAIGERVAVVETKIDAVVETIAALSSKVDRVLDGQALGKQERAEMSAKIEKMAPDVALVAQARSWAKTTAWVGGIVGGIAGSLLAAKGWIVLNWNWIVGR